MLTSSVSLSPSAIGPLQNVKKIKGAADKYGLKNVTCKQGLNDTCQQNYGTTFELFSNCEIRNSRFYDQSRFPCYKYFTHDFRSVWKHSAIEYPASLAMMYED